MLPLLALTFLFLILTLTSLWIVKTPKVWGSLLFLTLSCSFIAHLISIEGLALLALFFLLWIYYYHQKNLLVFLVLIAFSMAYQLHLLPGYNSYAIPTFFSLSTEVPLIGLFPLALLVPLMKNLHHIPSFFGGLLLGAVGIALLAILALSLGVISFDYKLPSFFAIKAAYNFFFIAIPEEGLYRGFVQKTLSHYFGSGKRGSIIALFLSSLLFTIPYLYGSPTIALAIFVFLSGMLYGTVYHFSKNIESAICTHFLLNIALMSLFSYHGI